MQTRAEGIHSVAEHCVNRLIALGLVENKNDLQALEVVKAYLASLLSRFLCGEWEPK